VKPARLTALRNALRKARAWRYDMRAWR